MNRKIIHIGKYFEPFKGGIERVMYDLMDEQTKSGHCVEGIVHQHNSFEPFTTEQFNKFKIHRLPIVGTLLFVPLAVTAVFYLYRLIKQAKPDILHLHLPNALCFWLLISPYCRRIPWVVHWHSDIIGDRPDWRLKLLYPLYAVFETALLKKSAAIVTTSPNYLASSKPLQKWLAKCHSIPLGIATKPTMHNDKRRLTSEPIHILCVGRFTYYKAQINLLNAVKVLIEQNRNVHLTLVGNGEDKNKLVSFIAENGLSSKCKILSGLSDEELEQQLINCDILCLPSIERTEAFGVVLLEAMRAGKPCICTSVKGSGMSYVVNDNVTGFVVNPSDIEAITEAIEKYINSPELLKKHGLAGRKRFGEHFEISRTTNAFSELYSQILS